MVLKAKQCAPHSKTSPDIDLLKADTDPLTWNGN